MTLGELSAKINIDLLKNFFEPLSFFLNMPHEFSDSEEVIVANLKYFGKAMEIFEKAPLRTFANYIGWLAVAKYAPYIDDKFRRYQHDFFKQEAGLPLMKSKGDSCYDLIEQYVSFALGRIYVEHHHKASSVVDDLVDRVYNSFESMVMENNWLSDADKAAAKVKLESVIRNIEYPSWIHDDKKLDEVHGLDKLLLADELMSNRNYMLSVAQFNLVQKQMKFQYLRKPGLNQNKFGFYKCFKVNF